MYTVRVGKFFHRGPDNDNFRLFRLCTVCLVQLCCCSMKAAINVFCKTFIYVDNELGLVLDPSFLNVCDRQVWSIGFWKVWGMQGFLFELSGRRGARERLGLKPLLLLSKKQSGKLLWQMGYQNCLQIRSCA